MKSINTKKTVIKKIIYKSPSPFLEFKNLILNLSVKNNIAKIIPNKDKIRINIPKPVIPSYKWPKSEFNSKISPEFIWRHSS